MCLSLSCVLLSEFQCVVSCFQCRVTSVPLRRRSSVRCAVGCSADLPVIATRTSIAVSHRYQYRVPNSVQSTKLSTSTKQVLKYQHASRTCISVELQFACKTFLDYIHYEYKQVTYVLVRSVRAYRYDYVPRFRCTELYFQLSSLHTPASKRGW